MFIRQLQFLLLAAPAAFASAAPAFAHHAMDGVLPATLEQGLISGLAHPVIGLDHLAFVAGVGLASAFLPYGVLLIGAFIVATLAGCGLHLLEANLPAAEIVIAASVLVVGVAIMSGRQLSAALALVLFALAGLFHGYAYGESIVGAEQTPLAAYLAGFATIQFAIAFVVMAIAKTVTADAPAAPVQLRVAGGMIAGVGLTFLFENLQALILPGAA